MHSFTWVESLCITSWSLSSEMWAVSCQILAFNEMSAAWLPIHLSFRYPQERNSGRVRSGEWGGQGTYWNENSRIAKHIHTNSCHVGPSTHHAEIDFHALEDALLRYEECFCHVSVAIWHDCDSLPIFIFKETGYSYCSTWHCTPNSNFWVMQKTFMQFIQIFSIPGLKVSAC